MATTKKAIASSPKPRTGDISARFEELEGPYKVYLPTGRKLPDGKEAEEEYTEIDGTIKKRPEREKEPFLVDVWYRKNYMTAEMEDELRDLRMSDEFSEVFDLPTGEVITVHGEFEEFEDEHGNKGTRPKTRPVMKEQRVPTRRLNAAIHTLVRVVGKWDVNSGGAPIPIEVEAIRKSGMDAALIYAILNRQNETNDPPSE